MDVDSRAECDVDRVIEVGGEEDDSFEVFKLAEENYFPVNVSFERDAEGTVLGNAYLRLTHS